MKTKNQLVRKQRNDLTYMLQQVVTHDITKSQNLFFPWTVEDRLIRHIKVLSYPSKTLIIHDGKMRIQYKVPFSKKHVTLIASGMYSFDIVQVKSTVTESKIEIGGNEKFNYLITKEDIALGMFLIKMIKNALHEISTEQNSSEQPF